MLAAVYARQGKQGREIERGTSNTESLETGFNLLRRGRAMSNCKVH